MIFERFFYYKYTRRRRRRCSRVSFFYSYNGSTSIISSGERRPAPDEVSVRDRTVRGTRGYSSSLSIHEIVKCQYTKICEYNIRFPLSLSIFLLVQPPYSNNNNTTISTSKLLGFVLHYTIFIRRIHNNNNGKKNSPCNSILHIHIHTL